MPRDAKTADEIDDADLDSTGNIWSEQFPVIELGSRTMIFLIMYSNMLAPASKTHSPGDL